MKNAPLPLLLLLSASTFGLGHELGANGPRDNPDTPWGPGDKVEKHFTFTKQSMWYRKNRGASFDDYLDACAEDPTLRDNLRIEEEVGDWVLMPGFGLVGERHGEEWWFYFPHVLEASKLTAPEAKLFEIDIRLIIKR
jgi:hypothetical protein